LILEILTQPGGRRFPATPLSFLWLVPLLTASSLNAANYFVATYGSDGNPGTSDAPFLSLQQAVNMAGPGDAVIVRDGAYGPGSAVTGGDGSSDNASAAVLFNSGAPTAWITIKSENKWGAVLNCAMQCDSYINLYNSSYVVIQDFVIMQGFKEGIHSNDSAHHIALLGNRIEYIANRYTSTTQGLSGIYTGANCHDFIVDGNVFHDIGRSDQNRLDHGLYLHGWNFTITNNVFYNIPHGWSIQAADGLSNVLIGNNTFAFPNGDGQDGQIMLWNTQSNLYILNNIFYQPQGHAIARYDSTMNNCVIDNNLVYGADSVIADGTGCGVAGTIGADPNFVNVQTPDFHLQWNSPAIAAGSPLLSVPRNLEGNLRPQNSATDLGAY
jgi:hypothetical protein